MSADLVLVDWHGDVAVLTLNDPATLNAASQPMVQRLLEVLDDLFESARCLVITGAGRAFCSGANLSSAGDCTAPGYDAGAQLDTHYNPLIQRLRTAPIPIVTAINGAAAGFGASLALAGDLSVAADTGYFLQAFRHIGLVPDGGSAFMLVHAAGRVRASEMMLLGNRIAAAQALEWGMINRVVPAAQLLDAALGLAQDLAAGPTQALGLIRRLCWDAAERGFSEMLAQERMAQQEAGRTADHREGIGAFLAKRKPAFGGNAAA
ncbi:2-(1,2-epoxy-1,2-dihydrophenyl)acetyl-CoA isomerase [Novosphingobium sp. 1529]|uniref:enoyl-CoA hydratase-related protein n=1 Tax=Novosphingobium sp. 1529 TaxID=3156424 RepID=UPI00339A10AA